MERIKMIQTVGLDFLTSNIENGEFSYAQVLGRPLSGHYKLDIRFFDAENKTAVLIETKTKFKETDKEQLFDYVALEREYDVANNIVAILANTQNDKIQVWKICRDYEPEQLSDKKLKTIAEYIEYFRPQNINDKSTVLENTATLNKKLHDVGIKESLRSQFVGTCLLALKKGLSYENMSTEQIIAGIKGILGNMLGNSMDKATKLAVLQRKVLENDKVEKIEAKKFAELLKYIKNSIMPYINAATSEGHDILSYFFTTFNKYVAREDKNQAFTPNHIAHFMCKVANVCKTSRILDPTCGSGTFLVQAMTMALNQCETEAERNEIRMNQIYGIEADQNVFGLSTTNMLIHGDGNSNIRCCSCFDAESWIKNNAKADVVLMNPPYNASKDQVTSEFAKKYGKSTTDPSKGLFFVKYIADTVGKGRLVTLLPMSCAISTSGMIADIKEQILEKHTLDAVFSFPAEMFYPGASAVACCMVFDLGRPHSDDKETFFGYFKDDGFEKRKGIGRVDVKNRWADIEQEWLYLYEHRETKIGKSITQKVSAEDEWCAEAYMETDYSNLGEDNFINTLRDYAAFLIQNEHEL